ncbi:MAG: c-type cytochrome, partial [Acidobacteriota bacterium]
MNRFLKGALACGALALMVTVLLASPGFAGGATQRRRSPRVSVDELFNRNCARCHGADGRGDTPSGHLYNAPNFTDPEWWKKNAAITTPGKLRSVVVRGKAG